MVLYIVKKGGDREPFQPEKIVKSCIKAGASKELAEKVAEEVSTIAYVQMPTEEIGAAVVDLLKRFDPKAAKSYAEYEKKKKKS
jgi:transcriptional regulator NrdR family protein